MRYGLSKLLPSITALASPVAIVAFDWFYFDDASEVQLAQQNHGLFHFHGAAFSVKLRHANRLQKVNKMSKVLKSILIKTNAF